MSILRVILGDQLSSEISALAGLDPTRDTVLMMEMAEAFSDVGHHKQKLVLVLSAMRHFADGSQMASKPYAASGAYIDRMSDYCSGCAYDVKHRAAPTT